MKIGVARETAAGERRVALSPEAVERLIQGGHEVAVQAGAGGGARWTDDDYRSAGATVVTGFAELAQASEAVVGVQRPPDEELEALRGKVLIAFLQPLSDPAGIEALEQAGVIAFALEAVPRISRAQAMDALSSQSTVGGYKAVLLAAERLPRFFPMLITAAGTVPPARVLVLGAGVAGLQAIATARRLGAVVSAFDTRPVVKEQVQSLGATFLELELAGEETAGGYAVELTEEQHRREQELVARHLGESDVVITTALVPGRAAPRLVTAAMVASMRPGSVIVDLAAEAGGNCELTEPGEEVERDGVTILGLTNLPSTMPVHASQLLSRNVSALVAHLAEGSGLLIDLDDEITAGACVTPGAVSAPASTVREVAASTGP